MNSFDAPWELKWETNDVDVLLTIDDGVINLRSITPHGSKPAEATSPTYKDSSIPLHQVRLVGEGTLNQKSTRSLVQSYTTCNLRYQAHKETTDGDVQTLSVTSWDDAIGLTVTTDLTVHRGIPLVRFTSTAKNSGKEDLVLTQLSSLTVGGLTTATKKWWDEWSLSYATNSWFREAQWHDHSLPEVGLDDFAIVDLHDHHHATHAAHSVSSRGTFSTGRYLPIGVLKRHDNAETWLWTIENNGSWRWEVGDYKDSVYVSASGPTSHDHAWQEKLAPGESFTSVPATICHVNADYQTAVQVQTQYRRRMRRQHEDNEKLPLIFNDYMNCLMGDPDEDKIKSLLEAVLKTGAEYFVIDAGWYADDAEWWDDVGAWEPSKKRFPSGFAELLQHIRSKGLIPGLWIEPEVIGVRSKVVNELPAEAFFHEHGRKVLEKGRYQLDFRHPKVIERMDGVVDRLVKEYGAGYFKFDYNVDVIQGTDVNAFSSGAAMLGHNRAYLDWINGLYDRHPGLVIETCSSGAQRMDYAMLSVHSIQSTSDQQDPVKYAAIAAAIHTGVAPEQAATWAYPQDVWSDEANAMTVVNSLLGRIHLSGTLDRLTKKQMALIKEGMDVYKTIRMDIKVGLPFWPLGLPKWHDGWCATGLEIPASSEKGASVLLAVWKRGDYAGGIPGVTNEVSLVVRSLKGKKNVKVELLYPKKFQVHYSWHAEGEQGGALKVKLQAETAARLFRLIG